MGLTANYAIVVARLIIESSDYGPHSFMVQIRDLQTHQPLQGVQVGDLGEKFGTNQVDHGYLRFSYMRISRKSMLTRFARVKKGGEYQILDTNGIKILYQAVMKARAIMVKDSWMPLAKALTITVRYSIVRRQFPIPKNSEKELQLIDYQIQQYKIFTCLSLLYGTVFSGKNLMDLFDQGIERLNQGDDSLLGFTHALTALYKAYITQNILQALETLRKSCGGHGFLASSNMPALYKNSLPGVTVDGQNHVLILQTVKYFVKIAESIEKGVSVAEKFRVLAQKPISLSQFSSVGDLNFHIAFYHNLAYISFWRLIKAYKTLKEKNIASSLIWNDYLGFRGIQVAEAFFAYSFHDDYVKGVQFFDNSEIQQVLNQLRKLQAVEDIQKFRNIAVQAGCQKNVLEGLSEETNRVLMSIRPNALVMVEGFLIPDEVLISDLGCSDGEVYQNLLKTARVQNPINKHYVLPAINRFIRPRL